MFTYGASYLIYIYFFSNINAIHHFINITFQVLFLNIKISI